MGRKETGSRGGCAGADRLDRPLGGDQLGIEAALIEVLRPARNVQGFGR
jgi:hypothetical protein